MSALNQQIGIPNFPRDGTKEFRNRGRNYELVHPVPPPRIEVEQVSRRDWFANNAPEVPNWFRFGIGEAPREPVPLDHLTPAQVENMRDFQAGRIGAEQVDAAVARFAHLVEQFQFQKMRWGSELKMKRMAAWRFHYADNMIAAGSK